VHIPYRGFPPAVTDMLAGNIDAMFAIVPAVLPHVKTGKMRALAVTTLQRSALAPEVPSVAELGLPALESLAWNGLLAPTGTAAETITRLNAETVRGMRSPEKRKPSAGSDSRWRRALRRNFRAGSARNPKNGPR
jgi:tripartite-type tricarboxylate transporter receptor subunit TctC